jgi:uncharacterized tellurite resistance protein B-like protein
MWDAFKAMFQSNMSHPEDPDPEVRQGDLRLAACALLLELAYADDQFSEAEREHLRSAVRRQWALDPDQADELIRLAERERTRAVDLWQFTNLIKQNYSLGQKLVLAEIMWGLVYADGELASREDYLMRKISGLLALKPGYLTEARKRAELEEGPDATDVD